MERGKWKGYSYEELWFGLCLGLHSTLSGKSFLKRRRFPIGCDFGFM